MVAGTDGHGLDSAAPRRCARHYRLFLTLPAEAGASDDLKERARTSSTKLATVVAQLQIEAPPKTRITVDGQPRERMADNLIPVAPGAHTVEADVDAPLKRINVECGVGAICKVKFVETPAPQPAGSPAIVTPQSRPVQPSSPPKAGFWTTGRIAGAAVAGGGVVALGLGVVFHTMATSSEDEVNSARSGLPDPKEVACKDPANDVRCAQVRDAYNDQQTQEGLRTGFLIGGGALLLGGAALFLLASPKTESGTAKTQLVPIANGRDAGVALVGRF